MTEYQPGIRTQPLSHWTVTNTAVISDSENIDTEFFTDYAGTAIGAADDTRVILFGLACFGAVASVVPAIDIDGNAMTKVGSTQGAGTYQLSLWRYDGLTAGTTATIRVNNTGTLSSIAGLGGYVFRAITDGNSNLDYITSDYDQFGQIILDWTGPALGGIAIAVGLNERNTTINWTGDIDGQSYAHADLTHSAAWVNVTQTIIDTTGPDLDMNGTWADIGGSVEAGKAWFFAPGK